jgi:hypothetical protein
LRRGRRKANIQKMWVVGLENLRLGSLEVRFREGAVARLRELIAEAIDKAFGVSKGNLSLESALWPHEGAQKTHDSALGLTATGDAAGALRHAPAYVPTFKHATIPAHMTATNSAPHTDVCEQKGDSIINPTPGLEYHPPAQPVDINFSIMLSHAEDHDLLKKRGGQQYKSCKEEGDYGNYSGNSTSNGRVSPETSEDLSTRSLPAGLPERRASVERPAGRKQSKRKAKPKISPADTEGRGADLASTGCQCDNSIKEPYEYKHRRHDHAGSCTKENKEERHRQRTSISHGEAWEDRTQPGCGREKQKQ